LAGESTKLIVTATNCPGNYYNHVCNENRTVNSVCALTADLLNNANLNNYMYIHRHHTKVIKQTGMLITKKNRSCKETEQRTNCINTQVQS